MGPARESIKVGAILADPARDCILGSARRRTAAFVPGVGETSVEDDEANRKRPPTASCTALAASPIGGLLPHEMAMMT